MDIVVTTGAATSASNAEHYGDAFYAAQVADSERSAREYVRFLWTVLQPSSVADLGCGRGAWLKVFAETGATRLFGYDGPWNSQDKMIDARIVFRAVNLETPLVADRVDLAMSLEVAEHLVPEVASTFVGSLIALSDVVMFAAAFTNQLGTNHINERPHSYWAEKFDAAGYAVFDLFRPHFWGNADVCFWYRQNTFLYVSRKSNAFQTLAERGFEPVTNLAFLDCVHPEMFLRRLPPPPYVPSLTEVTRQLLPALRRAIARRL